MLAAAVCSSATAGLTDQDSQKSEINLWDRLSAMKHCYGCHTAASHTLQLITSHTMAEGRAVLQCVCSHYCWAAGHSLIFHTARSCSCKCVTSSIRLLRETVRGAPTSSSLLTMNEYTNSCPCSLKSPVVLILIKAVIIRLSGRQCRYLRVQVAHERAANTIKTKLKILFWVSKTQHLSAPVIHWFMKFILGWFIWTWAP